MLKDNKILKNIKLKRSEELNNCTPIKAILMLIIVLYHSMIIYADGGVWGPCTRADEAPFIGYIAEWMNTWHIYAFVLISGYIFYYIKYEKGGYQKYLPFLKNKTLRLLVPYVFIATVWIAPVNAFLLPNESIIQKFVLGTSPRQLWFLLMLFWVFAIFWLISNIVNKKPLLGSIIVCIAYCIGLLAPSYYCLNLGLQYLLFFYIGFMMRKFDLGNKILYKIPSIVFLIVDIGLFAVCEFLGNGEGIIYKVLNLGCSVVLHAVGAVSAFVLLQKFVNRFLQGNKVIDFFGKHSMVIYLVHQQLIYFIIGWFNGIVTPVVLVMINFVFSLTVSTIFSVLMHKTRVTRLLVGSK